MGNELSHLNKDLEDLTLFLLLHTGASSFTARRAKDVLLEESFWTDFGMKRN